MGVCTRIAIYGYGITSVDGTSIGNGFVIVPLRQILFAVLIILDLSMAEVTDERHCDSWRNRHVPNFRAKVFFPSFINKSSY